MLWKLALPKLAECMRRHSLRGTAVYRNELARRVQQIGYRLRPAKHGFEIEGVSEEVLKRFSKRSRERDAVVRDMEQKLGRKLSNNEISHAVHQSRTKKVKGISSLEVRERQLVQLSADERQTLQTLRVSARPSRQPRMALVEDQALNHAVEHVFERKSVAAEHELLAAALRNRPGAVDLTVVERRRSMVRRNLVRTERGFTTKEILETELSLIQTVNTGCDAVCESLCTSRLPARRLAGRRSRNSCGYTSLFSAPVTGSRACAGWRARARPRHCASWSPPARRSPPLEPSFSAPTTAAATDVLRKEGVSRQRHSQSLLLSKPVRCPERAFWIVLDEAGAVGIDDMKGLFDLAQRLHALCCRATPGQHASVAACSAMRCGFWSGIPIFKSGQLTAHPAATQRRIIAKAVELAAQKRPVEAFAQLEQMGAVAEFSGDKLHGEAARSYLKALAAKPIRAAGRADVE